MKQQVSPAVVAVVIVIVIAIAGFFVWKGAAGNVGSKRPGEVGNASPFAPGGAAIGKGGGMPAAAQRAGNPFGGRPAGGAGGGQ